MNWKRLWPLPLAAAIGVVVHRFPTQVPDSGFYGIVAQVIPVLIVAVALDGRGMKMWERTPAEYRWQITVFLLAAQLAAMLVIAGTVDSGEVTAGVCTIGLIGGFLAVAVIVLLEPDEVDVVAARRTARRERRRQDQKPS